MTKLEDAETKNLTNPPCTIPSHACSHIDGEHTFGTQRTWPSPCYKPKPGPQCPWLPASWTCTWTSPPSRARPPPNPREFWAFVWLHVVVLLQAIIWLQAVVWLHAAA